MRSRSRSVRPSVVIFFFHVGVIISIIVDSLLRWPAVFALSFLYVTRRSYTNTYIIPTVPIRDWHYNPILSVPYNNMANLKGIIRNPWKRERMILNRDKIYI